MQHANLLPWSILILAALPASAAPPYAPGVGPYGSRARLVDLTPGYSDAGPVLPACYAPNTGYYGSGSPPSALRPTYPAAAYPPSLPVGGPGCGANGCCQPPCGAGGSYGDVTPVGYRYGAGVGYGGVTPVGYRGYPANYPYWTAPGAYNDTIVGSNLFGQPTRFDRGEPLRNVFRWLLP